MTRNRVGWTVAVVVLMLSVGTLLTVGFVVFEVGTESKPKHETPIKPLSQITCPDYVLLSERDPKTADRTIEDAYLKRLAADGFTSKVEEARPMAQKMKAMTLKFCEEAPTETAGYNFDLIYDYEGGRHFWPDGDGEVI